MTVDWAALSAGIGVGLVVGMTGSGGGALLTPILILLLGVDSKSAVASDLVATLFMRPVASAMHLRHRTIQWPIVRRLVIGSVPSAFLAGVVSHLLFASKHSQS
ncbi:MAG TPA: sulfite exporter TauE/SafE family protein, partial [Acidimicrobiales bacterium]|nr:sulfite exporter TauE/SafE family protein [Acidimicrobiales bacterium]